MGIRERVLARQLGVVSEDTLEHLIVRPNGEARVVEVSATRITYSGQSAVLAVIRDITERKKIEGELRGRTQQLQSLSRQLVDRMEAERRSIALELHDEIGQHLTVLKLSLAGKRHGEAGAKKADLNEAIAMVDALMARVRDLSFSLRPGMLDDLGLLPAIIWLIENYSTHSDLRIDFKHRGLKKRFPAEVETAAYRILQEALTNIARHSGADQAKVRVWSSQESLGLRIEDRGVGFEPADLAESYRSIGLSGMRERVSAVGGQFELESAPGAGTRLMIELPLPQTDGGEPR